MRESLKKIVLKNWVLRKFYAVYLRVPTPRRIKAWKDIKQVLELKDFNLKCDRDNKIKVRILFHMYTLWNSTKSICRAFEKNENVDLLIVVPGHVYDDINQCFDVIRKEGYKCVDSESYSVEKDCPDIFIAINPSTKDEIIERYRRNSKLVAIVPFYIIHYGIEGENYFDKKIITWNADYLLCEKPLYRDFQNIKMNVKNLLEMGNAKFDDVYNALKITRDNLPWPKLMNKRVVLWATSHGIYKDKLSDQTAFDVYYKEIFNFFSNNDEYALIFRPHQLLIKELLDYKYWSKKEYNRLREWFNQSDNLIWDDSESYNNAFSYCDAIITDAYCGIAVTALPTLKPVLLLYRNRTPQMYDDLNRCHYTAYSTKEMLSFFEMLSKGEDDRLEVRKEISKKMVKHFDGKNGERIKDLLLEGYDKIRNKS